MSLNGVYFMICNLITSRCGNECDRVPRLFVLPFLSLATNLSFNFIPHKQHPTAFLPFMVDAYSHMRVLDGVLIFLLASSNFCETYFFIFCKMMGYQHMPNRHNGLNKKLPKSRVAAWQALKILGDNKMNDVSFKYQTNDRRSLNGQGREVEMVKKTFQKS